MSQDADLDQASDHTAQEVRVAWSLSGLADHLRGGVEQIASTRVSEGSAMDPISLTHLIALDSTSTSVGSVGLCLSRRYLNLIEHHPSPSSCPLGVIITRRSLSAKITELLKAQGRWVHSLIVIPEEVKSEEVTALILRSFQPLVEVYPRAPVSSADHVSLTRVHAQVHPSAQIHPSAQLHPSAQIDAFVVVEAGVSVEAEAHIGAFGYLGPQVKVKLGARLSPRVTILGGSVVESYAVIHTGAVIGSPGFGLDQAGQLPHHGSTEIGAGARIGALTCVDRATLGVTRVGAGAQLDNLIQVGHNVRVGEGAVLCAQTGLAGGASLGAGVVLGGQVGVTQRVHVGDRAYVGAKSGVTKSLAPEGRYSGYPAEPHQVRLRREARLRAYLREHDSQREPLGVMIHPSAQVDPSALLEPGVIIGPGCVVSASCHLEPHVILGEDVRVGHHCYVEARVVISAGVTIGERSLIRTASIVRSSAPAYTRIGGAPSKWIGLHFSGLGQAGFSASQRWILRRAYLLLRASRWESERALLSVLSGIGELEDKTLRYLSELYRFL